MMKLVVERLSPGQVALGALALSLLLLDPRGQRQRRLRLHIAIASSIGSVLNSATPLATVAVNAVALRQEKATPWKTAGIVTGAVGIFVVLSPWRFYAADAIDPRTQRIQSGCRRFKWSRRRS